MRKNIIIAFLILLCVNVLAQERRGVALGVNLTGNFTAYTAITGRSSSYSEQFKPNVGYGAGLFVTIPVAGRFSIQAEVQYDALRATLNPRPMTMPMMPNRAYSKREYLSIPLMLQYEFGKKHKFFVNFGPALKFNLSSRYNLVYDDRYYSIAPSMPEVFYPGHSWSMDQREHENRMVVALVAGFGMKIPVAKRVDFVWEARLSGDISRVFNPNNTVYLDGTQALNLALKAGVAYRF